MADAATLRQLKRDTAGTIQSKQLQNADHIYTFFPKKNLILGFSNVEDDVFKFGTSASM